MTLSASSATMKLNNECLRDFLSYFAPATSRKVTVSRSSSGNNNINFRRILRLSRRPRRILLSRYQIVSVEYKGGNSEYTLSVSCGQKDENEAGNIFSWTSATQIVHKDPVDAIWYTPYITSLSIREYRGPLSLEECQEVRKKAKYDENCSGLNARFEDAVIRTIEGLENSRLDRLRCTNRQLSQLPLSLTASSYAIAGNGLSAVIQENSMTLIVCKDAQNLGHLLSIDFGRNYDQITEIKLTFGFMSSLTSIAADLDQLMEYLPNLSRIRISLDRDEIDLTPVARSLTKVDFKKEMELDIVSNYNFSYMACKDLIFIWKSWTKENKNISVKFYFVDYDSKHRQLAKGALKGFQKRTEQVDVGCPRVYVFEGPRIKVEVVEGEDVGF